MGLVNLAKRIFLMPQDDPEQQSTQAWNFTELALKTNDIKMATQIALTYHDDQTYFHCLLNADREDKLLLIEELNKIDDPQATGMVTRFFRSDKYFYNDEGHVSRTRNMAEYLIFQGTQQNAAERLMRMIETQDSSLACAKMLGAGHGDAYEAFVEKGFGARVIAVIDSLNDESKAYLMPRISRTAISQGARAQLA